MQEEQGKDIAYFEDQPFTGTAETLSKGVKIYESDYRNGRKAGAWSMWDAAGNLQKNGFTRDGKEDGMYREYYPSGALKYEYHYDLGKKTGQWRSWYENGVRWTERDFVNDKLHGKVHVYDTTARLTKEYFYRNGELYDKKTYLD